MAVLGKEWAWFFAAVALVACEVSPAQSNGVDTKITGYAGLTFGDPFHKVVAKIGHQNFAPYGLADCEDKILIQGCNLVHRDGQPFNILSGIPFWLGASFNRFNRLTDFYLVYKGPDGMTINQCLNIHERSLDWIVSEFGALYTRLPDPRDDASQIQQRTTPNGLVYEMSVSKGSMVSGVMRTAPAGFPDHLKNTDIRKWNDDAYVSSLSYHISGQCRVRIQFSDSPSVERSSQDNAPKI